MSDDEGFLARWSRRKRGAARNRLEPPKPVNASDTVAPETPAASVPPGETQPGLDLARLPPIDSIRAGTDIRAFLAAGVPAELRRAALRRAWSADPAIRDFVGLSENSWDFNAIGQVTGFGTVAAEDVRRLVAQAMGESEPAKPAVPAADQPPVVPTELDVAGGTRLQPGEKETDRAQTKQGGDAKIDTAASPPSTENIAVQQESQESEYCPPMRRHHGSALPD